MTSAEESYLGWDELHHHTACKRPAWTVDTKTEYDVYRPRDRESTAPHACPAEECGHGPRMERTTVRIVCRSCGCAYVITSETGVSTTSTRSLGYGLAPERRAGLLLWQGQPFLSFGRLSEDMPWDYIVTRPGVTRPVREDLVGEISQTRGKRGAVRYGAVAVPDPYGRYGYGIRWAVATDGLATPTAAARWIAAQLAQAAQAGGATATATGAATATGSAGAC
ncbi:hypothetical protein [Actinacidiphila sp. ITFR-21]|uniref:hypothetical protein n=1 Tax=Actinacidiphila sp. ITFR-21 TaxID=3075199 RepID=UPI00288AF9D0|nr:hypothetical protein [Streptomyces sp. ITFR-21]WNI16646.1 hypothetical protein RLT57_14740 [Streptomyces sp. ITFR-21]